MAEEFFSLYKVDSHRLADGKSGNDVFIIRFANPIQVGNDCYICDFYRFGFVGAVIFCYLCC